MKQISFENWKKYGRKTFKVNIIEVLEEKVMTKDEKAKYGDLLSSDAVVIWPRMRVQHGTDPVIEIDSEAFLEDEWKRVKERGWYEDIHVPGYYKHIDELLRKLSKS